jgi:predicted nucleic-acid-binding protein
MVETVWVLDRAYRLATNEIAAAVERMLQTDVLVVEYEQKDRVRSPMLSSQRSGRERVVPAP